MASFLPTTSSALSEAGHLGSKFNVIEEAWFDKSKKDHPGNWKRRYFNLDSNNKSLSYFVDDSKNTLKGIFQLTEVPLPNDLKSHDKFNIRFIFFNID